MASSRRFAFILSISFLIFSCQDFIDTKPSSSSREGELLVILPNYLWDTEVGDSLRYYFTAPVEGLGQYEPQFKVLQIQLSELNNPLKISRNILLIHLNDSTHSENPLTVVFNKWAEPQLVLNLYAKNEQDLLKNLKKHHTTIIKYLNKEELKRKVKSYKALSDKSIQVKLKELYGFYFSVPKGYKWSLNNDQFSWIRNETSSYGQNIWVYKEEINQNTLTPESIIQVRNRVCKNYIPGPTNGSYMKTAGEEFLVFERVTLNGIETIRTKGLWDLEGDFMGGPFVNYSFKYNNQIILIEGFVYAPGKSKHAYIKQLNAMINSIVFDQ